MPFVDKKRMRDYCRKRRAEAKLKVLAHYGKDGKLQCCWPDCGITDIDMLGLDHLYNDGAKHRKSVSDIGKNFYFWIIKNQFPDGYQTLCLNHNSKKELMRLREIQ